MPTDRKFLRKLFTALLCCALSFPFLTMDGMAGGFVDYAASVRLNWKSETAKQEVTVESFVDGDTTHFTVPKEIAADGVLKARYLAINTPESTGKIEPYGKKASQFTKEKLSSAVSIVIESDDGNWNLDSTGGRYLVWVWYKPDKSSDYRNLNIELLQEGLAVPYSASSNRYGEKCVAAVSQAKNSKLNLYSGKQDPDYYYGDAVELTLRELRCHPEAYEGMRVAFTGGVTMNNSGSVYVEQYDPETGLYFGMPVFYGYNLSGEGLNILSVGNEVRIVGSFQYYEKGEAWQVTDVKYRMMKPDDPGNIQKLGDGYTPAYTLTPAGAFAPGNTITVPDGAGAYTDDYAWLMQGSTVEVDGLYVRRASTTSNPDSAGYGAITLQCESEDGETLQIRTEPLFDENGELITQDQYLNRTINVQGIVDRHNGKCQIRVFLSSGITVVQ